MRPANPMKHWLGACPIHLFDRSASVTHNIQSVELLTRCWPSLKIYRYRKELARDTRSRAKIPKRNHSKHAYFQLRHALTIDARRDCGHTLTVVALKRFALGGGGRLQSFVFGKTFQQQVNQFGHGYFTPEKVKHQ